MTRFVPVTGREYFVLAVRWDAGWEFDAPTVVLEPVLRFTTQDMESAIEDVLIDVCCGHDAGKPIRLGLHPAEQKEFDWRGWSVAEIRAAANAGRDGYRVLRGTVRFFANDRGETDFEFTPAGVEVAKGQPA